MASSFMSRAVGTSWAAIAILGAAPSVHANAASSDSLKSLSVEELMNIEVTSVSRRPEKLLEAPAAVQVITGEEIRRSGAPNIPSALRLAASLSVAQENAHEWVISARGFSSDVGNKLLVMIDGRTVYTPLFSGVFWDRQDYLLEDIDRIEVIGGPGGTLWGANAVNGVININTKTSQDTQGLYLEAGGGTDPKQFGALRYGGTLSQTVSFRVYGKYSDLDSEELTNGMDAQDDWHTGQGGFRLDTDPSATNQFTLQGDYYDAREGIAAGGGDSTITGMNVLGRWSRRFSEESDLSAQLYYDRTELMLPVPAGVFHPAGIFRDDLDTYDLDFQHRFQLGERHRLVWGFGLRFTHDEVGNAPGLGFFPTELDQRLYSGFLQDEIRLSSNVVLTVGSKVEHTDYTGYEFEPNARLQWTLSPQQTVWGAISRAVRTPSRIDREISQPSPGYVVVLLQGGPRFESENLLAYELGYRAQLNPQLSLGLSTFYNDYDDLRSTSLSPPDPLFGLPFPFFFENNLEGETYGFELTADYQVFNAWRLKIGYNLLQEDLRIKPGKTDFNNALNETADPQQQVSLRSSFNLPLDLEFDAGLRWVDIRTINNAGVPTTVPDYYEMDMRLGWKPSARLQLSIVGQNLLNDRHPEYGQPGPGRVQIRRSVYGKFVWNF